MSLLMVNSRYIQKILIGKKIGEDALSLTPIGEAPLLELSRCKHCGEYVALASVNTEDWTYEAIATDDSDMFDLDMAESNDNSTKKVCHLRTL